MDDFSNWSMDVAKVAGRRYRYKCLSQGWSHIAFSFYSIMSNALVNTITIVYVDDILVGEKQRRNMIQISKLVLTMLQEMGMHLNPEKVRWQGKK